MRLAVAAQQRVAGLSMVPLRIEHLGRAADVLTFQHGEDRLPSLRRVLGPAKDFDDEQTRGTAQISIGHGGELARLGDAQKWTLAEVNGGVLQTLVLVY
jgi:hypothetical protein